MKNNIKQIEQIIELQKELNKMHKDANDGYQNGMLYDAIEYQIMQKESELENLVNNLTKKKMRILIYKLLEEIK